MATNKRKENFISKIVKNPSDPPKTILLRGYLGDSSEADHTRLYYDAQLNSYVEIPNDAILHEEEVSSTPPGESYVWIKQDAQVIHGEATPQRRKSSFFEGPIAAAAARAPRTIHFGCQITADQGCLPPPPRTPLIACPPVTDQVHVCHTLFPPCEVESALCPPTPLRPCPVTSPFHVCQTIFSPCEVQTLACPPTLLCPVTSRFQACQTIQSPCEVQTLACPPTVLCPVTSRFRVCQTPVVPCELETALCPPPPTPLRGCPVTSPFRACQTPVVPCELETALCPPDTAPRFCFVSQVAVCQTPRCGLQTAVCR